MSASGVNLAYDHSDLQYPPPPDNAKLTRKIIGFAAFGCFVRAFQLGIMQRPLRTNPQSYAYSSVIFGGIGYGVFHAERRQKYLLAKKRKEISERRDAEVAQLKSGGGLTNALTA